MTVRRSLIIAFLLLAFTSQLFANASMTCGFEKPTEATATHMHHDMSGVHMHDMAAMDHESHEAPPHSPHTSVDCCKTMGQCLFGGCFLVAASKDHFFAVQKQTPLCVDFYSRNTPTPLVNTHYRPPISV